MSKPAKKTILVVEDEQALLGFVCEVLQIEGYRVLQAEDGDAGLRLVRTNQIALVLLDLRLPRRDGWSVLSEIKKDPGLYGIPVILFTASSAVDQRDRALSMGAAEYLVKPASASDLVAAVAAAIKAADRHVAPVHRKRRC